MWLSSPGLPCWELSRKEGKEGYSGHIGSDPTEQKPAWYEPFGPWSISGCQRGSAVLSPTCLFSLPLPDWLEDTSTRQMSLLTHSMAKARLTLARSLFKFDPSSNPQTTHLEETGLFRALTKLRKSTLFLGGHSARPASALREGALAAAFRPHFSVAPHSCHWSWCPGLPASSSALSPGPEKKARKNLGSNRKGE